MIRIEPVTGNNLRDAIGIYEKSWRESHRQICSAEFLMNRDYGGYLRSRRTGLYLVTDGVPVGVFRVHDGTLSDLYIHPNYVRCGYGTACVRFALAQSEDLRLTVLSTNDGAIGLYWKMGFRFTGRDIPLGDTLREREMIYMEKHNG